MDGRILPREQKSAQEKAELKKDEVFYLAKAKRNGPQNVATSGVPEKRIDPLHI